MCIRDRAVGVERDIAGEDVLDLAAPSVAALVGGYAVSHGTIGDLLQVEIKRGVDTQPVFMHLLRAEVFFEFAANFFLEPRGHRAYGLRDMQSQRGRPGLPGLRVGDGAVGLHFTEHQVAASQRSLGIENGRIGNRALGQAGEKRGLGQCQIFGVFRKEIFRSSLEAVHAAAEIDLIGVKGENLLLGKGALNLDGEIGLLNFAHGSAIGGEKEVARQLHGECRCALGAPMRADVVPGGAGHAKDIDAPVGLEIFVFDRDDGLAQHGREAVVAHYFAALQREGADDAALAVVEIGSSGGCLLYTSRCV